MDSLPRDLKSRITAYPQIWSSTSGGYFWLRTPWFLADNQTFSQVQVAFPLEVSVSRGLPHALGGAGRSWFLLVCTKNSSVQSSQLFLSVLGVKPLSSFTASSPGFQTLSSSLHTATEPRGTGAHRDHWSPVSLQVLYSQPHAYTAPHEHPAAWPLHLLA